MEGNKEKRVAGSFYQFCPDLKAPIFVFVREDTLTENLLTALNNCCFFESKDLSREKLKEFEAPHLRGKLLLIEKTGPSLISRVSTLVENDASKDQESVQSFEDHFLYRYYGHAAMVYSFHFFEWKLGLTNSKKSGKEILCLVLNRFLALALAPFGIIGLWGKVVGETVQVMNLSDSKSEVVYLSIDDGKVVASNGQITLINDFFRIGRYDRLIKEERRMGREELYAFIMARMSYLHPTGPSEKIRNKILTLSKGSLGTIYPYPKEMAQNESLSI